MPKRLSETIEIILAREAATPLTPGLYIVATPIGNLADITLRALSVLTRAQHVYCEDTRHSIKLLSTYGITTHLSPYHDHNADRVRPKILRHLEEGKSVALISDAGTPLISDPGFKLVRDAAAAGYATHAIPGCSSVITALSVSGLPTDAFFFAGFLPSKAMAARRRLTEIGAIPGTLVFFETASRLDATLAVLSELFPGRGLVIARELTKRFEEIVRVTLPYRGAEDVEWKGEFVLLVAPPIPPTTSEKEITDALAAALERLSLRDAVEEITRTFDVPKRTIYNLALQLNRGTRHAGSE